MHLVTKRILGMDNKPVFDLQEMFSIKGHLCAQSSWKIDPSDLDELLVNILFDNLIQLLSDR